MATPRGAEHRDLEQRLRNIESMLRSVASAALRRGQLSVASGDFAVSGGGSIVLLDGGGVIARYPDAVGGGYSLRMFTNSQGGADLQLQAQDGHSLFNVSGGDGTYSSASMDVDTLFLQGSDQATLGTVNGGPYVVVFPTGTEVQGKLTARAEFYMSGYPTTSSGANVFMSSAGRVMRVQSSLRYKTDVADAEVDTAAVLDGLQGRTWRDKAEVEDNPDTQRRYVGYIAEEVHEAGLSDYVLYDAEGRPDGIAYDRLTVPLLAVAKAQRQQLDEQAALIQELSARVGKLEAAAPPA